MTYERPRRSTRTHRDTRRRRTLLPLVSVAVLVLAACGSSDAAGAPNEGTPEDRGPAQAGDSVDAASQPLDTVVADFAAPTGGTSVANMVRLMAWAGEQRARECGTAIVMQPEDRYDQVLFPDFERIRTDGIGLLESLDNASKDEPAESSDTPAEPGCGEDLLPDLGAVQNIQGQWIETVVYPTWSSESQLDLQETAVECLRDQLDLSPTELPALDAFFGSLDGQATNWAQLPETEARPKVAALDHRATEAFLQCAPPVYEPMKAELEQARIGFLDQHAEALQALGSALDERGYVP